MAGQPRGSRPESQDSRIFMPARRHLSAEDYADFAENVNVPVHCLSASGRVLWANKAELSLLGYAWEEFVGHHISEFHPDQEKVDELLGLLLTGENVNDFECRLRRSDGSSICVAICSSGLWRDGKFLHSRCVTREISKQRQLEIDLREHAHQLERTLNRNESLLAQLDCLLAGAPAGIAFLDTRLRYVRLNAAMAAMHGVPVEAHVGLKPREVLREGGEELEAIYTRVLRSGRPEISVLNSELWGQGDNHRLVCSYYPVLTQDGEKLGIGVTAVDVTERHLAEAALRQSEDRLHKVIHAAPIFMWAVDKQGKFIFAEGAGLAALGLKPGDLDGVSAYERFGHLPEIEALTRALNGKAGNVTPKVGDAWFDVTLLPTHDESGEISGAFGVAVDVTSQVQAKEKQHELEESLKQSRLLESVRVMAGGIGHDLNNLLTAILGNVNLGLLRLPNSSSARYNMEQIGAAARYATELTREMLACAGRNPPKLAPLDVNRFVDSLSGLLDLSLGSRVMVREEFSPMLPAIMGDAGQLSRVVLNLAQNSAEAIDGGGGTIDLCTGVVEATAEDLARFEGGSTLAPGNFVFLDICDDGIGMDDRTLHSLFTPFFSTKKNGGGLSLAAALGIMRSHGGAIGIESSPGHGTRIRLLFPIATGAVPENSNQQPGTPMLDLKPGTTILVIDDDEAVRQVAKMMLEDLRLSVLLAENGAAALEIYAARQRDVALVVLDLTMPGLSGEETLDQLRKLNPDVNVVISTGYTEREVALRMSGKRIAGFLPKPYSPAMMRDMLAAALTVSN